MNYKFIDVSGVGNSGKTVITDLLREVDGIYSPHFQFEFDILRVRGGLIDLRHAITSDWSPIRSHAALNEFRDIVQRMGRNPKAFWDILGWLISTSQRYDRTFKGSFTKEALEFADGLVVGKYKAEWPYDDLQTNPLIVFIRKIIRRLGGRSKLLRNVQLVENSEFDLAARQFINKIYCSAIEDEAEYVVLNNGFEPFNPKPFLDMLNAQQIVVTRDPRDVYVSGLNNHSTNDQDKKLLAFDNDGLNKSFLATDDIKQFINRYRIYHQHLDAKDERVLRLSFEELILNYDDSVTSIFKFLKIDPIRHSNAKKYFDPFRSSKNIGVWKKYSKKKEIELIENQLSSYLIN